MKKQQKKQLKKQQPFLWLEYNPYQPTEEEIKKREDARAAAAKAEAKKGPAAKKKK